MKNYKTFMSTLMLFVLSLVMAGCDEQLDKAASSGCLAHFYGN